MSDTAHQDDPCAPYRELLDELVDGTIDPEVRPELDAHLVECGACRAQVADFKKIRAAAEVLERRTPPAHVWEGIAAAIEAERQSGRGPGAVRHTTDWRWLAVAAALVMITGTVMSLLWMWRPTAPVQRAADAPAGLEGAASPQPTNANASAGELVESIETELRSAEEHYVKAIAGLEQIARAEQSTLDPLLASTLKVNMDVIDQAIGESRSALRAEPTSRPAQQSLFEALRRKVSLLQDTIVLMNEMRKGNEAGAARIVEGINKS